MMRSCQILKPARLVDWVDGALSPEEARTVALHVESCKECSAVVAAAKTYRQRMRDFAVSTEPAALPAGFWENVQSGLNQVATIQQPIRPARVARRWAISGAVAAMALLAIALALMWRGPRVRSLESTLDQIHIGAAAADRIETGDADRAAQWLGGKLRADIPSVNLSLVGARLTAARAYPNEGRGSLHYDTASGKRVSLHLLLAERIDRSPLKPYTHRGTRYSVKEERERTTLVWESGGRTFIAEGPLNWQEMRPIAHEMARRCERNQ